MIEILVFFIGVVIGVGILAMLGLFYLIACELLHEIRKGEK